MSWMATGSLVLAAILGGESDIRTAADAANKDGKSAANESVWRAECADPCKKRFESDREFCNFIGPISNPVLSKDPRSLTEVRFLFVNNWIDSLHPLGVGGNGTLQLYTMQARIALNERLSLIADKDGYAVLNPSGADEEDGWVNAAGGLKYVLVRDVEDQFLLTTGIMYEMQSGEAAVFQSHGDGLLTLFSTAGKEICRSHVLATIGQQLAIERSSNSGFFYTSLHFDRRLSDWLYPLVEVNWFHYTSSGNRGIPAVVGEGDGLINIGTSDVTGNDLLTVALGIKAKLKENVELGGAWESPISNRHDLIGDRITAELILRY